PGPNTRASAPPRRANVTVIPTPTPSPKPRPTPSLTPTKQQAYSDLNARLRALLPNNPVNPSQKSVTYQVKVGAPGEPVPPPEILARTKYLYTPSASNYLFSKHAVSFEGKIVMYVTSVYKRGITQYCRGWMFRYPKIVPENDAPSVSTSGTGVPNGGVWLNPNVGKPIIEPDADYPCDPKELQTFVPPTSAP
ncbi:MAG: hypothetical protein JOZ38_00825, partial [Candidatus Eremiobacteraeota bacterium]|nr:hypothetical protein [Candidatus Eremiobacteraeota bacterium]